MLDRSSLPIAQHQLLQRLAVDRRRRGEGDVGHAMGGQRERQ